MTAGVAANAAVVYKWVDADGVVHLSDQPVPGAERIVVEAGTGPGTSPGAPAAPQAAKPAPQPMNFTQFAIVSPAKDETFTNNNSVTVSLALAPGLTSTQTITWSLNGRQLTDQPPDATQFTLDDLPRGSYTVSATITDQATGESQTADSVTFYVMRPTLLSPLRKSTQ